MPTFEKKLKFGNKIQEKIIKHLERYWNFEFIAGDRNSETVNPSFIEKLFGCKYIPIKKE